MPCSYKNVYRGKRGHLAFFKEANSDHAVLILPRRNGEVFFINHFKNKFVPNLKIHIMASSLADLFCWSCQAVLVM